MDAGKLDTQIAVVRLTKSQDEFGGFTSTEATVATYWANLTYKDGNIKSENGQRQHFVGIELVMRKKTVDEIQDQDLLQIEGAGPRQTSFASDRLLRRSQVSGRRTRGGMC